MEGEEKIISRSYQTELEELAMKQNTIIHLPTGSGKTFIAIRLITRMRESLKKPWGEGGKRTFFLVNTVPLVTQQCKFIQNLSPVKSVRGFSGEEQVDFWNKAKWDDELSKYEVIVMTSQILNDMLTHCYIKVEDINLIIFDECHHAVDKHPMRQIMKHFELCPLKDQPRVVGLTATLLNSNGTMNTISDLLKNLEVTFQATIATVNEMGEVLKYSTNPKECMLYYKLPFDNAATIKAKDILSQIHDYADVFNGLDVKKANIVLKSHQIDVSQNPNKAKNAVINLFVSMSSFIDTLGVFGGSLGILYHIIILEKMKSKALSTEASKIFDCLITIAVRARAVLEKYMENDYGYAKITKHSSMQVLQLIDLLKEYNPENFENPNATFHINRTKSHLSGIIFVKKRFTAIILYNLLNEVRKVNPKDFGFLQHDFVLGSSSDPRKITREDLFIKKLKDKALLKFRNSELNCMISTSVIEEGVDIPQCLLIVQFDQITEYRAYVQSKGRARNSIANFVMMIEDGNKSAAQKKYKEFIQTESYLQDILVGKSDKRYLPADEEIQEMYDDDDIPPYINEHGGRLSAVQAVSLISRYCSMLPQDQFTTLLPTWILEKREIKNKIGVELKTILSLLLPLGSPVQDVIMSDPSGNIKMAKQSAALKACIRLHQEGELHPITMLPKKYIEIDFDVEEIKYLFPNWPKDPEDKQKKFNQNTGSKKRLRKHKKIFPLVLRGIRAKSPKQTFYLHLIKLKPNFDKPKEPCTSTLYEFLNRTDGYGILTSQPLPSLCDFPMYLSIGEVQTSLEVNYKTVQLNEAIFEIVKRFHLFIFDQVLQIVQRFLLYDGKENCMFVVPVHKKCGSFEIAYDIMERHTAIRPDEQPSLEERKSIEVVPEEYKHSVISPWYRSPAYPERYIVVQVLEYLTPMSKFGNEKFETYADYYSEVHQLQIVGRQDQPLLLGQNITTGMNCLLPRGSTLGLSEKQNKLLMLANGDRKKPKYDERFIPEFCIKHDYPGWLWYKANMLPSILHRIQMLLNVDELRTIISNQTKIGMPILPENMKWKPIETRTSVVVTSLLSEIEPEQEIGPSSPSMTNEMPAASKTSMKKALFSLQLKKLDIEYHWDTSLEPLDLDRNITTATVMDIENYMEFGIMRADDITVYKGVESPNSVPSSHPALLPPPENYKDTLDIIERKPSQLGPELRDLISALTTIKTHDAFHLERVETLGDSLLKFSATVYLYHKFPKLNEGRLTNIRSRIVGNKNLYYAGEKYGIAGRMKVEKFSPRQDFLLPGFFAPKEIKDFMEAHHLRPTFLLNVQLSQEEKLSGQISKDTLDLVKGKCGADLFEDDTETEEDVQPSMQCYIGAQVVADKSVADSVEALIGTYLENSGIEGGIKIIEWLKILPEKDNFLKMMKLKPPSPIDLGLATAQQVDFLLDNSRREVEAIINYTFNDPALLLEALTHPSYVRNRITRSYQRLEFLGDAILDFLITSHIYETGGDMKPGMITDLRMSLVNNVTFASYVVKLGLHKYMCKALNPKLDNAIMDYVEFQKQRDYAITEDVLYLIEEEDCFIAEYIEVPKAISDVFESLAGAIYLDSGGNLSAVWKVYYRIMWRELKAFADNVPKQPIRQLMETVTACPLIGNSVVNNNLGKVMVPVTITKDGELMTVHGFGNNSYQAKCAAAKIALKVLGA